MNVFEQAGLSADWGRWFVFESNRIDPSVGDNAPGHPSFDAHLEALTEAVSSGLADRFALPRELHAALLPGHPLAGLLRTQPRIIGLREALAPVRVPYFTWRWNADAREQIGAIRTRGGTLEERRSCLWGLHYELMNVRPFELFNGRVGRLLLVNHSVLLGLEPEVIYFEERDAYLEAIREHSSRSWVETPLYKPSAVCYREWHQVEPPSLELDQDPESD